MDPKSFASGEGKGEGRRAEVDRPEVAVKVRSRAFSCFDALLVSIASALSIALFLTAAHDVSTTWDVWYYHLPFAARIAGIIPAEVFAFHPTNQARYEGFPLLGELLQGLLWRAFGRPEASNFVALGSLFFYIAFLKRAFHVPLHLSLIALLAIPLVQLHATSCYVDLPGNLAAAALFLSVYRLYTRDEPLTEKTLLVLGTTAACAANMRFQLHAPVSVALLFALPRVFVPLAREFRDVSRVRALGKFTLSVALLLIVFATPLKNLALHANPYYPMHIEAFGLRLPGPEDVYASAPPSLERATRMERFVSSLLEVGIRPMTDSRRWTIDQWMPEGSNGNRMGGFFHAYVIAMVTFFVWIRTRSAERPVRRAVQLFALMTAITALLPQSHELRYYLYWMIVLVSLNVILVCQGGAPKAMLACRHALGMASVTALAAVLAVTRCGYVYPSGSTSKELVLNKTDAFLRKEIQDGERVCLSKEPFTILYSSAFHPPRRYALKETELPPACGDHRFIE